MAPAAPSRMHGRSMERMSDDTMSDAKPSEKPLITLLNAPLEAADDTARPASQCCGGGSCSM